MLGYYWLFALFLSRLSRCFTRVQGEVESAPTYLTAILESPKTCVFKHWVYTYDGEKLTSKGIAEYLCPHIPFRALLLDGM